jgi:hypothetical protein
VDGILFRPSLWNGQKRSFDQLGRIAKLPPDHFKDQGISAPSAQFALRLLDVIGLAFALKMSESSDEVCVRNLRTQQRAIKSMPITSMRYGLNSHAR